MQIILVSVLLAVLGACHADWRVTRGQAAKIGEIPWVAHVGGGGCTASVLNAYTVLTAGHCVCNSSPSSIVVGALRTSGSVGVRVASVRIHPSYQGNCGRVHATDIAIVKMASPIPFTQAVQPIDINCDQFGGNTEVYVMGYGRDELGRSGVLNWAKSGISSVRSDGMLVSEERQFTSHILPGDSGGPVTRIIDGRHQQVGVNSGGGYGTAGHTAYYASIRNACQFIKDNS